MATTFIGDDANTRRPAPHANEVGQVVAVRGSYAISAALVINDVIQLCKLPANHVPVACVIDCDDLDTNGSPAIVLSAGLDSSYNEFITGSTVAQAGGLQRETEKGIGRVAPTSSDRTVGVKVTTAPATGATSGTIGLTLYYRQARYE